MFLNTHKETNLALKNVLKRLINKNEQHELDNIKNVELLLATDCFNMRIVYSKNHFHIYIL